MTAPFTATRIDLTAAPTIEGLIPEGWDAELMEAVETGKISYRRALKIAASR